MGMSDQVVDRFVKRLNAEPRPSAHANEVPKFLHSSPVENDLVDWRFMPHDSGARMDAVIQRLGRRLPPSFASLYARYAFMDFEYGSCWFFPNTGVDHEKDYAEAIFRDDHLSTIMLMHGYVQCARVDTGDYDPICFDTNRKKQHHEYPMVQLDHEEILIHDRIKVVREVAPSFRELIAK